MYIKRIILLFSLLFICYNNSQAAAYFHLISGGGGGYQFSYLNSNAMDNFISAYNNQENRKLWNGVNGSQMTDLSFMHGYYLRYAFYKYVDKTGSMLTSYQISGEFENSYSTAESWFSYKYEQVDRNLEFSANSVMLSFAYGFNPWDRLLLYGEAGIGYDHFSVNSVLSVPGNLTRTEVIKAENDLFNTENIRAKNNLKIQDGHFSGHGISLKSEIRGEYFITPQLEADLSISGKYIYIDRLKNDKENLRSTQFSENPLVFESMQYAARLGLSYYFVLE